MKRITFAVVGCGRISANHFAALEKHRERTELVAVCDNDPVALAAAVKKTGVKGFSSLDALLAGSDAQVIVLCTPSGLHAQQGIKVAAAGRHVVSEKPMATRGEDGQRMVEACDASRSGGIGRIPMTARGTCRNSFDIVGCSACKTSEA